MPHSQFASLYVLAGGYQTSTEKFGD